MVFVERSQMWVIFSAEMSYLLKMTSGKWFATASLIFVLALLLYGRF